MPIRFKVLSVVYVMLLLVAGSEETLFDKVGGIMGGLAVLMVLSVLALWPNASRADRVDRSMSGSNWADRIQFDTGADRSTKK